MIHNTSQSGFILLMSSIVISAILVAVVFSLSFSGFFTRFNLLDSENKEKSYELAYACFDIGRLKLNMDSSYTGNESIVVGSNTCYILPIVTTGILRTRAVVRGATTNLEGVFNPTDLSLVSVTELPEF